MGEEKEAAVEIAADESIMSLEDLKEAYANKNREMKEKYKDIIEAISKKHDQDLGVAFDMLKAVYMGGKEYIEGIEIPDDRIYELMKDCKESMELAIKITDKLV